jgi:uncharacterized repeat protein (TIGR03806 family)
LERRAGLDTLPRSRRQQGDAGSANPDAGAVDTMAACSVVETRGLLRRPSGWIARTYEWNTTQDDATLISSGDTVTVEFFDDQGMSQTAHFHVASEMDCHTCHDNNPDGLTHPIGLSARQINRDFDYPEGAENQLAHWARIGMLAAAPSPSTAPRLPVWNDPSTGTEAERGRAYLEANCAHCHNPYGLADKAQLNFRADDMDPIHLGICKVTLANSMESGGLTYDVAAGDPDHSVMIYRLASTEDKVMMPLVGRSLVHTEGLQLVREWVAGLPGSCGTPNPTPDGGPSDGASPDAGVDGGALPDAGSSDASALPDAGSVDAAARPDGKGHHHDGGDDPQS